MSKLWLKRILQVAGTLALIALVVGVYRRTDWSNGFTPDGALTLVAGVIAFIAVVIQIRSSSKQVENQIKAQHDSEREEQERQKRAVATAIAFEIDSIYRGFIRDVEALFKAAGAGANFEKDLMGKRLEEFPFTVYEGCSPLLGGLPPPLVQGIVHLYGGIAVYLMTINELYAALQRAQSASLGDHRRIEVDVWVHQVKDQVAPLRILAAEVSKMLCEFAGIPKGRMAVLAVSQGLHA
jgi:hypothetical protein